MQLHDCGAQLWLAGETSRARWQKRGVPAPVTFDLKHEVTRR
jgi:hypothetical protein